MTEAEILARVAAVYLPVPYLLHGADLGGWDCRGLVRFGRADLFAKGWPSEEIYTAHDAARPRRVRALIEQARPFWRRVPRGPGAVVLLTSFGAPGHVGLMITRTQFVHVNPGDQATTTGDVRDDRRFSVEGFYDG